jgi:TRAP-type C4-dicarboxylate transport system permease small subunit
MDTVKKVYGSFCKLEEFLVSLFIGLISFLVFISAILRFAKMPINWGQDVALLLFAWVVFLGADIALRRQDFVRVDMFISKMPLAVQKFLYYLWYIMAIGFLGMLVVYGIPLSIRNFKRLFQTLPISYSWATMAVPIGAALMMITILIKLAAHWHEQKINVDSKEAI